MRRCLFTALLSCLLVVFVALLPGLPGSTGFPDPVVVDAAATDGLNEDVASAATVVVLQRICGPSDYGSLPREVSPNLVRTTLHLYAVLCNLRL